MQSTAGVTNGSSAGVTSGPPNLNDVPTQLLQDFMADQPESDDQASSEVDEALKLKVAIATLHSLEGIDSNAVQSRANREYVASNMQLWRSNLKHFGLQDEAGDPMAKNPGEDMGHTVRVDSDDKHFHYHQPPPVDKPNEPQPPPVDKPSTWDKVWPWLMSAGVLGGGTALLLWMLNRPPAEPPKFNDTDTRSTLRPYTGP